MLVGNMRLARLIVIYGGAVSQKIASALQLGFPDMHSAAIHSDLDTCCRQTLPHTVCPRLYFAVTHLPTTPSGKIDRRFCELNADALNPFRLHPRATVSEERHDDPPPSSHCGGEETLSTPSLLEKVRSMWYEMVLSNTLFHSAEGTSAQEDNTYFLEGGGSSVMAYDLVHRIRGLFGSHQALLPTGLLLEYVLTRSLFQLLSLVADLWQQREEVTGESVGQEAGARGVECRQRGGTDFCEQKAGARSASGPCNWPGIGLGTLSWWRGGTSRGVSQVCRLLLVLSPGVTNTVQRSRGSKRCPALIRTHEQVWTVDPKMARDWARQEDAVLHAVFEAGGCKGGKSKSDQLKPAELSPDENSEENRLPFQLRQPTSADYQHNEAVGEALEVEYGGVRARAGLMWKSDLVKCVDASTLVVCYGNAADGGQDTLVAIVGSHAHLVACIEVSTGVRKWTSCVEGRVEGPAAISSGGRIVVVGTYGCKLYLICVSKGQILACIAARDAVKGGAFVDFNSNTLYFGSHDGCLRCASFCDPAVYRNRGVVNSAVCLRVGAAVFAAPVPLSWSSEVLVVCSTRGRVVCFRRQGCASSHDPQGASDIRAEADVKRTVVGEGFEMVWAREMESPIFGSATSFPRPDQALGPRGGGLVAVGCANGGVYALETAAGGLVWNFQAKGPVMASPLLVESVSAGMLLFESRLLFGCQKGYVYCVRAQNGRTDGDGCWQRQLLLGCQAPISGSVLSSLTPLTARCSQACSPVGSRTPVWPVFQR